jgi:hypothetical protein
LEEPVAAVYEPDKPRRRGGRRVLSGFFVLLIILVLLLTVADRAGASYAQRVIGDKVAQQVANQKATSDKPDVTIEGIPFLTQVVQGRYQEIKIELRNFSGPAGNGKNIKMPLLDIRAKDVDAPLSSLQGGGGDVVAKTVTGTGTVDYATVASLVGQQGVKLAEQDGKLAVTAPLTVLNQKVTVHGTANLTVHDNIVSMKFDKVTADGLPQIPLVDNLLLNYARQISVDLRVPPLPLKLAVTKVQPTAAGLVFTAGASNVKFNSGNL